MHWEIKKFIWLTLLRYVLYCGHLETKPAKYLKFATLVLQSVGYVVAVGMRKR